MIKKRGCNIKLHLQSTLPMRGATVVRFCRFCGFFISIHAPHAGSDPTVFRGLACTRHFNPRSPCGERLSDLGRRIKMLLDFNPRSPCGERPLIFPTIPPCPRNFNPRSPCGERHVISIQQWVFESFQSTLPMRGATHLCSR